ncbi:MAG: hypothetical protein JO313_16565 [Verrucomicrobia bacterium]|nr:hypothetical protein [Verrucomicrobiota bacterium]MBV9645563.1 hypothetical protein [Verrucomicrobiota bacterium]
MREGHRKILVLAAVFSGGLFVGVAVVVFLQARPEPAPDTTKLKDLLHNTAQQEIGLPPLADVEVELTIERGNLEQEIERIKALAAKFGGAAIQGIGDDTGTDVMAEISPRFTDQFLEALKHPEKQPVADLRAGDSQNALVQVRLRFQS